MKFKGAPDYRYLVGLADRNNCCGLTLDYWRDEDERGDPPYYITIQETVLDEPMGVSLTRKQMRKLAKAILKETENHV